ncbi:HAD hydrolase-like protein [Bacillus salitolerans]|uniref:HAD hydrolase-like protein n=1 Tax=Bacillus salitolerans TaxID=1437434 RepID=A0ABW4LVL1_9BACI
MIFTRNFKHINLMMPLFVLIDCNCHKPKPGMLLEASKKYKLDLTKTVFIGDVGSTDMLAAHYVGAMKI